VSDEIYSKSESIQQIQHTVGHGNHGKYPMQRREWPLAGHGSKRFWKDKGCVR
jgi:hypothetical protein